MDKRIQDLMINNLDRILHAWFLLDDHLMILQWSAQAEGKFGYSEHEVIGKSVFMLLPESNIARYFSTESPAFSHDGSVVNYQAEFRKKNGIIFSALMNVKMVSDEQGQAYVVLLNNITEILGVQRLVYSKMTEIQEKYLLSRDSVSQETMEDIFDAILVAVTAGQGMRFNRAFILMLDSGEGCLKGVRAIGPGSGEEAARIYGNFHQEPKTLEEAILNYSRVKDKHNHYVNHLASDLSVNLADDSHVLMELLKDPNYCLLNYNLSGYDTHSRDWLLQKLQVDECIIVPMTWHGVAVGMILADNIVTRKPIEFNEIRALNKFGQIAGDVIQSVKLLNELEQNILQLRHANQSIQESQAHLLRREQLAAKGELMAQMAHEIRGPLATVGGFARRVFNKLPDADENFSAMNHIVDTVKTLESVVNDILQDTPTSMHRNELECDVHTLINKVMNLLNEEIQSRDISVNLNIQGDLPLLPIQTHQLFEILNNLMKNALEAIGTSGLLAISALHNHGQLMISITDSGPGMSEEEKENLFTPFYTTKQTGTGLGLVVVKKLVEESSGTIAVMSVKGSGTTFTVKFPVNPNQD